jgi:hypothetical protein
MKLAASFLAFALFLVSPASSQVWNEADFQRTLCNGMKLEVRLGDHGRADCVSDTHAIEVEWADKFKEGIGQALTYATSTDLIPGLILICRRSEGSCLSASLIARETFSAFGIEAVVWECGQQSRRLSDCLERRIEPSP